MKKVSDYNFKNKKILLRVDVNSSILNNDVTNLNKIKRIKKTIKSLEGNDIYLLTHLGRPESYDPKLSTRILKRHFINVKIIENVRFNHEEYSNDQKFAKDLSSVADIYVNEAWACSHRKHASIDAITNFLPSYAGPNFVEELENIEKIKNNLKEKSTLILGGSKLDKLKILEKALNKFDKVILAGTLFLPFLKIHGHHVGSHYIPEKIIEICKPIYEKFKPYNKETKLILPIDYKISENEKNGKFTETDHIDSGKIVMDVGEETLEEFIKVVSKSKNVFWNGTLGYCEAGYHKSTLNLSENLPENAIKIISGGDSTNYVNLKKFNFVSMGGGATLNYLLGENMPGLDALNRNDNLDFSSKSYTD